MVGGSLAPGHERGAYGASRGVSFLRAGRGRARRGGAETPFWFRVLFGYCFECVCVSTPPSVVWTLVSGLAERQALESRHNRPNFLSGILTTW